MPHMSIGNAGTSPSIQYGISSMPVNIFFSIISLVYLIMQTIMWQLWIWWRLLCQIVDKPNPVRIFSFLTSRHLSQRRIRLPTRKYHPKNDGSRVSLISIHCLSGNCAVFFIFNFCCMQVPFFSDDDEAPSTPKADALFVPRENPRALIIRPVPKSSKETCVLGQENGIIFP